MRACWYCKGFSARRPPCEGDALRRRRGWPCGSVTDGDVLSHMRHVRGVVLGEAGCKGWPCSYRSGGDAGGADVGM